MLALTRLRSSIAPSKSSFRESDMKSDMKGDEELEVYGCVWFWSVFMCMVLEEGHTIPHLNDLTSLYTVLS